MDYESLLYRALKSERGLKVSSPNPDGLRAALHRVRGKNMEAFAAVALNVVLEDGEKKLFIVNTLHEGYSDAKSKGPKHRNEITGTEEG